MGDFWGGGEGGGGGGGNRKAKKGKREIYIYWERGVEDGWGMGWGIRVEG